MRRPTEAAPPHIRIEENAEHGRLTVRLEQPVAAAGTGLLPFEGPTGDLVGLAYVPEPVDGGPYRLVLLAPQSILATWDVIVDAFGKDVRRINRLLEEVVDAYPIEDAVIGGFSDGASYALSIGLTNGDLFSADLAFSPGFAAPLVVHGKPRVFVSHGVDDRVLPIDACSRRLVPWLEATGYEVTFDEFDGGHEVTEHVVDRATSWLRAGTDRTPGP